MRQTRSYTQDERVEIALTAIEHGDSTAAGRYGMPVATVYWMRRRYQENKGTFERLKAPDYTIDEDAVILRYASAIACRTMRYKELATLVSEVGVYGRTAKSVQSRLAKLRAGGDSRQERAADMVTPDETTDRYADWVMPETLGSMFDSLIDRIEAGNPPRVGNVAQAMSQSVALANG